MRARHEALSPTRFGSIAQIVATLAGVGLAVFLILRAVSPIAGSKPPAGATEAVFRADLDRAAPRLLKLYKVPGVVISTVIRGEPAQTYAYGYADLARGAPMRPDTVFRAASISKSLTAWGVLRLAQSGVLDLDAPAANYLDPWPLPPSPFPEAGVTARRLLNHTAGLNAGGDSFVRPDAPLLTAADQLAMQGDRSGDGGARQIAPPGKAFLYSVPGYTLLQMLIERRSGRSFVSYMNTEVLQPLGMTSSSYRWDPALRDRTATPYRADGSAAALLTASDTAADSLFATGPDLAKFVAAPLPDEHLPAGANVLASRMIRPMFTAARLPRVEIQGLSLNGPGLGCFIERLADDEMAVMNGGNDPGWTAQYYIIPRTGDGVVILTNSDLGGPVIEEILGAWSSWRGLPPTEVTRAHAVLRLDIAVAVGLLTLISLRLSAELLTDFAAGARRLDRCLPQATAANLIEVLLAILLTGAWLLWQPLLQAAIPLYYGWTAFAIGAFVVVTLARLVFRRGEPAGPSERPVPRRPTIGAAQLSS